VAFHKIFQEKMENCVVLRLKQILLYLHVVLLYGVFSLFDVNEEFVLREYVSTKRRENEFADIIDKIILLPMEKEL